MKYIKLNISIPEDAIVDIDQSDGNLMLEIQGDNVECSFHFGPGPEFECQKKELEELTKQMLAECSDAS